MAEATAKSEKKKDRGNGAKGIVFSIMDYFWYDTFDDFWIIGKIFWVILLPIIIPLRILITILGWIFFFL